MIPDLDTATPEQMRTGARRRRPWLLIPAAVALWTATYHQPLWSTALLCGVAFVLITYAMPHLTGDAR